MKKLNTRFKVYFILLNYYKEIKLPLPLHKSFFIFYRQGLGACIKYICSWKKGRGKSKNMEMYVGKRGVTSKLTWLALGLTWFCLILLPMKHCERVHHWKNFVFGHILPSLLPWPLAIVCLDLMFLFFISISCSFFLHVITLKRQSLSQISLWILGSTILLKW